MEMALKMHLLKHQSSFNGWISPSKVGTFSVRSIGGKRRWALFTNDDKPLMAAVEFRKSVLALAVTAAELSLAKVAVVVVYVKDVPPLLAVSKAGRMVRSAGQCGLSSKLSVLPHDGI
jgi:hypothetical protein